MKKILSIFITILALCLTLTTVVSAGDADFKESFKKAIITENCESIIYQGKTYLPITLNITFAHTFGEREYVDLKFSSKADEEKYRDCSIHIIENHPYVLTYEYTMRKEGYSSGKYYFEESSYDDVVAFLKSEMGNHCMTENDYGMGMTLTNEEIEKWRQSGLYSTVAANVLENYERHELFKVDNGGGLRKQNGTIIRRRQESAADIFYLIYYPEYDRTAFYADGYFAINSSEVQAKIYQLTDNQLISKLSEHYDSVPEEELDWVVGEEEKPIQSTVAMAIFLFAFLPLALAAFSAVMLVKKVKRPYNNCYKILLCSSLLVLICTVILLIILL